MTSALIGGTSLHCSTSSTEVLSSLTSPSETVGGTQDAIASGKARNPNSRPEKVLSRPAGHGT
ncbi:hypothetical protein DPMN_025583 [Dreissena polymorpha]|uniref:Uncharacterized protein n=1 Tax=Dreissena polymorpha TaxID=45954 RepID=A0A9D4LQ32_DREPO|nr:hypothetical protein DPMN_025583 [Dreissena polymorpha]